LDSSSDLAKLYKDALSEYKHKEICLMYTKHIIKNFKFSNLENLKTVQKQLLENIDVWMLKVQDQEIDACKLEIIEFLKEQNSKENEG
jgi:hypothetical protein